MPGASYVVSEGRSTRVELNGGTLLGSAAHGDSLWGHREVKAEAAFWPLSSAAPGVTRETRHPLMKPQMRALGLFNNDRCAGDGRNRSLPGLCQAPCRILFTKEMIYSSPSSFRVGAVTASHLTNVAIESMKWSPLSKPHGF